MFELESQNYYSFQEPDVIVHWMLVNALILVPCHGLAWLCWQQMLWLGSKVEQSCGQEGISRAHLWFENWFSCRRLVVSEAFLCLDLYRPGMILPAQYDEGIQMSWFFFDGILSLVVVISVRIMEATFVWSHSFQVQASCGHWHSPLSIRVAKYGIWENMVPYCNHSYILPFLWGLQNMHLKKCGAILQSQLRSSCSIRVAEYSTWRNVVPYCNHSFWRGVVGVKSVLYQTQVRKQGI